MLDRSEREGGRACLIYTEGSVKLSHAPAPAWHSLVASDFNRDLVENESWLKKSVPRHLGKAWWAPPALSQTHPRLGRYR